MNVKFSTKFVAASAAAVMALSLAGCSGGSMDDSSSSSAKASGDSITIGTVTTNSGTAAAYGEAEVKGFELAVSEIKVKKVAVLYGTGDPYSSGVGEAFAKAAEKLGLEVVDKESSSSADDTEYSAQLQKIQASGAELLYAPYYYSVAGPYIIPQARSVGFEGYVMGPDGYDGLKLTGDKSQYNKTYYTTHYSADDNTNTKVQDFIKSYKSKNNAEPNTFAALGYDTIYMIKQAIEKAGENATREDVRNAVAGMTFDGVTGKFTMDKSGSPTKSVTVLEMKDGKPVYNTTVQPK